MNSSSNQEYSSNYNSNSPTLVKVLYLMVLIEETGLHILQKIITNNYRRMVIHMKQASMLQSMAEHLEGKELTEVRDRMHSLRDDMYELGRECGELLREKMERQNKLLDLHEMIEAETAEVYDYPPKASE